MTDPVVIVYPSDEGAVARWYRGEHEALQSGEMASASASGVYVHGAPDDVAATAYEVHHQLSADPAADVSWVATHRRVVDGLGVDLVALERPAGSEPRHAESVPAAIRRLVDANNRLVDDRARLTREVELLLWLHAEAAWLSEERLEPYEVLTAQSCERGLHSDWLVDSEHNIACPWCLIADLQGAAEQARHERDVARAEVDRLKSAEAAEVGSDR